MTSINTIIMGGLNITLSQIGQLKKLADIPELSQTFEQMGLLDIQ